MKRMGLFFNLSLRTPYQTILIATVVIKLYLVSIANMLPLILRPSWSNVDKDVIFTSHQLYYRLEVL